MTTTDIALLRLQNQQVIAPAFKKPKELVAHMGIMQSQDFAMSKWAVGLRLPGSTEETIERSFNKGELLRTHVLRPTWHLVSPDDIYWMLDLSAAHIRALMRSRDKELGLDEKLFGKCNTLIEKALRDSKQLTREEIGQLLHDKAKIVNDNNRLAHVLARAEIDQIICSGPLQKGKQTYALLSERAPKVKRLAKEEALAELAKRYFSSHGPATLTDFCNWSGLSLTEARKGLGAIESKLISDRVEEKEYWWKDTGKIAKSDTVYLLPAYDEFIIGYKDRSASLSKEDHKKILIGNGLFRPVIVLKGSVTGTWKRTIQKNKVIVETDHFRPHNKTEASQLRKRMAQYAQFCGKEIA